MGREEGVGIEADVGPDERVGDFGVDVGDGVDPVERVGDCFGELIVGADLDGVEAAVVNSSCSWSVSSEVLTASNMLWSFGV